MQPHSKRKVLMIDDDNALAELVREYLEQNHIQFAEADEPKSGLEKIKTFKPDLILLDVMLPGKSGFDLCKEIRKASDIPIIMLTARGGVVDRVLGLELGADDYLPKPFEARELLARIDAILRRGRIQSAPQTEKIEYTGLIVDRINRTVELDGRPIPITTAEFELLSLFLQHPHEAVTRDQISLKLRGSEWEALSRSVDAVMSRLRQKLEDDPKQPRFFKTIWGTGYMFIGSKANEG